MSAGLAAWTELLGCFALSFTQPSLVLFREVIAGWVMCPGRRTVTAMLRVLGSEASGAHDAYHRLLREGAWTLESLWRRMTRLLVQVHAGQGGVINLALDDTLFHRGGPRVEGAGLYRDAVRSFGKRLVLARGLNIVVITLQVRPPWGGEPLGLPISTRLYRKGGPTRLELAKQMIEEIAAWLPDHRFNLACDGAYAGLAGRALPRTTVISRMRRDAALFGIPAQRRRGQPGRPRTKGVRLPTPEILAKRARTGGWMKREVEVRGRTEARLMLCKAVLWYKVWRQPVLLVVVRDPAGIEHDDFFFTTDVFMAAEQVAELYADRWAIEDTFRATKQSLGGHQPQTWVDEGPERASALSLWLYAAIWSWYIQVHGARPTWKCDPWYTGKTATAFVDALAALRRELWRFRVFHRSADRPLKAKTIDILLETLARAA